ncbi:MAG: ABC transporter ATP-binding protein [Candidatus Hydrogenedentota bacterium]
MSLAIETHGLTKTFGDFRAVDSVDLSVERGTFYGFLGPNGAGKSTTIKMLTGLLAPSRGHITLLGTDFAREPLAAKKRIGVVPEDLCLFENLTGREYLTFIGRMYLMERATIRSRTNELLALMGLADSEKTLVMEYSHGMKKKLSLAAAILHDPELLFLDEPFEGIDAIASRTIRTVLDRLVQRGATIFLTSHILEIVEKLCTHVGIIQKGRLVSQGSLMELSHGGSLEQAFVHAVGEHEANPVTLSWLAPQAPPPIPDAAAAE